MEYQSSFDTSRERKDSGLLAMEQNWGKDVIAFFEKSKDIPLYLQILPQTYSSLPELEILSRLKDIAKSTAFINRAFVNRLLRESAIISRRHTQFNKPTYADICEALKLQNGVQSTRIEDSELQQVKERGISLVTDTVTGVLAAPWIVKSQPKDLPAWPRLASESNAQSVASEGFAQARRVQENEFRVGLGMRTSIEDGSRESQDAELDGVLGGLEAGPLGKEAQVPRLQKRSPGRKGSAKSLNYWQRTKITGNDHLAGTGTMNITGGRAGGSGTGGTHVVRPRSVDVYEP